MSNSTNANKQKLNIWMDKALVAQIDGEAAKRGVSRAVVVSEAVRSHLEAQQAPAATSADIALLRRDLEASFSAMAEAIKAQPIAVQEAANPPALPDPDAWKSKSLIDRILRR